MKKKLDPAVFVKVCQTAQSLTHAVASLHHLGFTDMTPKSTLRVAKSLRRLGVKLKLPAFVEEVTLCEYNPERSPWMGLGSNWALKHEQLHLIFFACHGEHNKGA